MTAFKSSGAPVNSESIGTLIGPATGYLSGPNRDEISLAELRHTLRSPAGSVTVSGFDSDANEPYIFTPSDVAGVQAWANAVTTGDSCSARVFYIPSPPVAVELEGQTLSAVATISQADLVIGTPDAVELEGRDLTAVATVSQAELGDGYADVTLTDSSVDKSGTAVIIRDIAEVAQVPVAWFAAGSVPAYLVRVRIVTGNGAMEVRISTDPTGSGSEAGPSVLVSLLSNLRIELTSPAGSITVSGFGTDTSEPYVFLPSDAAGVQAWANAVTTGDSCSARSVHTSRPPPVAVELEGQTLSAVATVSQAELEVGMAGDIVLRGQKLTALCDDLSMRLLMLERWRLLY